MPAYRLLRVEPREERKELERQLTLAVRECTKVNITARNHVKRFMMEYDVWQLSELDYPLRLKYENYLKRNKTSVSYTGCLHAFDKMKLHAMKKELQTMSGRRKYELKYTDRVLFLPHYPDVGIAERFIMSNNKDGLVWDFTRRCCSRLKEQIFICLNYVLTELRKLNVPYKANVIKNFRTLSFKGIVQTDMKEETKKAVFRHLHYEALATIMKELTAMRRLSRYLSLHYPQVESCGDMSREVLEEYLIYLQTENTGVNNFKSDLTRLRGLLETIGKIYGNSQLENLFLNTDIPRPARAQLKSYSEEELKRFNAAFAKLDEQMCRLMVIHQMLGTRISDTLTLQTDCLFEQERRPMIRIRQMKTNTFIKPVSAELELLIQKAIQYTKKKYGETRFIFVNEKSPERPMQYNTVQNRVMALIQKENLRDDKGELFGFGTHMFRHCYGIRLTEMHYDDWTIAKLLGHKSIKNVKYYRKMSHKLLADETREVRERKSRLIEKYLDGWGEEYEQIRQHD